MVGTMYAQQGMIKGTVRSANDGEPLIGVSVVVKGTTTGTITDVNGQFSIKANTKSTLVFSYIGYEKKDIVVSGSEALVVQLSEDTKKLDEVVVVGYGVQKKVNLTGAVSAIDGKAIESKPSQNVLGALQGELPGLAVTRSSGQPGAEGYGIRIRGFSSANDTKALVLIDGMEGDMTLLNPSDIESISVLKDAAAASIYGARAAAGVILVTTKNGRSGKVKINYQGYYGVNTPGNMPERLPSWEEENMINLSRINQSGTPEWNAEQTEWVGNPNFNYRVNPSSTEASGIYKGQYNRWDQFTNTDWIKAGTNKYTYQQSHSVSASGGDQNLNYLISGGYYTREGLLKYGPDKNNRYNFRVKINSQLNKYTLLEAMGAYQGNFIEQNPVGATTMLGSMYRIRTRQMIYVPAEDININRYNGDLQVNPIDQMINGGIDKNQYEAYTGKADLTIKDLVKGLKVKLSASRVNDYYSQAIEKRWLVWYDRFGSDGSIRFQTNNPNSLQKTKNGALHDLLQATVDYDLKVNDHAFHVLAGTAYENYRKDEISATVKNLNNNDFYSFNYYDNTLITNTSVSDKIEPWAMDSYFGRLNYNFRDRYLFEANIRYDGSSRLAPSYRWKAYPSFSAGWRVSQESFFKVPVISNLKLRASWGQLGNSAVLGLYDYLPLIQYGDQIGQKYYYQQALASKMKTWETVETSDLGFDLGLFNNRLSLVADYYVKYNKNMLATPDLPAVLGLDPPQQNIGELKTWGWDLDVKWSDKIGKVNYSVALNVSDSQNKLIHYLGNNAINEGTVDLLEGYPLNSIWGYKTDGYWASKAEYQAYKAANPGYKSFGDASIDGGDVRYVAQGTPNHTIGAGGGTPQNPGDLIYMGTTNGRYLFGVNLSASWKGFDFTAFFQGVGQRKFLISTETLAPFASSANMPWTIHRDYWTPTNTDAFWPRLYNYNGGDAFDYHPSDKWIQNGAYIRLKNIQLGYTVPIKPGVISNMRVYIAGTDVWEYSSVLSVFDPEVGNNANANFYPFFRTWSVGVNVTF
jgi:TonB-linked SusC/RagA family outer membrane protein